MSKEDRKQCRRLHEAILSAHEERIKKLEDCVMGSDGLLQRLTKVEAEIGIVKKAVLGDEAEKGLVSRMASVEKALSFLSKAYWFLFAPMLGTLISVLFLIARAIH